MAGNHNSEGIQCTRSGDGTHGLRRTDPPDNQLGFREPILEVVQ
jgi:hypothetical protein